MFYNIKISLYSLKKALNIIEIKLKYSLVYNHHTLYKNIALYLFNDNKNKKQYFLFLNIYFYNKAYLKRYLMQSVTNIWKLKWLILHLIELKWEATLVGSLPVDKNLLIDEIWFEKRV